jgi:hypothetical protein
LILGRGGGERGGRGMQLPHDGLQAGQHLAKGAAELTFPAQIHVQSPRSDLSRRRGDSAHVVEELVEVERDQPHLIELSDRERPHLGEIPRWAARLASSATLRSGAAMDLESSQAQTRPNSVMSKNMFWIVSSRFVARLGIRTMAPTQRRSETRFALMATARSGATI